MSDTKTFPFSDPAAVANYAEGPIRLVPGFLDLQRMAAILLAESAGAQADILVVGAGGGLELKRFAELQPGWAFDGVDPSAPMLALAVQTLGPLADRTRLHQGYIFDAPEGPFDGATCLLTLHFLPEDERRETLKAIHRRLKPGAPLVVAHHSFPQTPEEKALWLSRFAAFAAASGLTVDTAVIAERLPALPPERDEALMREAGFADVSLFYAAFTFRGWVARAARRP